MKELILMIAKSVVAKPGEVDEVKGKKTTVLELRVFKEDLGKVIVGIGIIIGVTLMTLGTILGAETIIGSKLLFFAEYLKSTILT